VKLNIARMSFSTLKYFFCFWRHYKVQTKWITLLAQYSKLTNTTRLECVIKTTYELTRQSLYI